MPEAGMSDDKIDEEDKNAGDYKFKLNTKIRTIEILLASTLLSYFWNSECGNETVLCNRLFSNNELGDF